MFQLSRFISHSCVLCDRSASEIDLCSDCFHDLPWIEHQCQRCGLPFDSHSIDICNKCTIRPPLYSAVISPLRYQFPINVMINRFKQNRQLAFGQVLGEILAEHTRATLTSIADDTNIIVPVPLHPSQQRRRGFNQAQILADILSGVFSWRVETNLCEKIHQNSEQKHLRLASRSHALKGAFNVKQSVKGERIIIVDDVVTSCATINELSKTLFKSGAADVVVVAAARTPSNGLC